MTRILHVVGARPNFVKMAPVISALGRRGTVHQRVVHTGQHYDVKLSSEMLYDLQLPEPDHFLGVGSGRHGEQTARVLSAMERVLLAERPDLVMVAGDVNSTLAGALAAAKLEIPVAHLEAGLRSGDWRMPEEINRVLTDRLSQVLFAHSPEALDHLAREGIDPGRVHLVGNTMIDSLRRFEPHARRRAVWRAYGVGEGEYVLVTLHRPSNVDEPAQLSEIVNALIALASRAPVLFPVHPRTAQQLQRGGRLAMLARAGVRCLEPAGYLEFLSLQTGAGAVVTDSGGVQEETSALGIPCYTLRPNTERPVTITRGTNTLLGPNPRGLADVSLRCGPPVPCVIPGWDGRAGERVARVITEIPVSRLAETGT